MATELVALKDEFRPRLPAFRDVLGPYRIAPEAFQGGVIALFEQNKWLLDSCEVGSIMNSCMSFAVLGLRLDMASQQGCVVPFKGKAQPIVMVKGYTVIAGRAGYTLQSRLIREGDKWKERGGSNPGIDHEPAPMNKGKIIGAYAVARSKAHPTLFTPVLSLDDLIATRDRSQGYQSAMKRGNPHPWKTDFDAMCLKTPKRLLAKDIPHDMLQAASWLETQHDLGRAAYLDQTGHGQVIDLPAETIFPLRNEASDGAPVALDVKFEWIDSKGEVHRFPNIDRWLTNVTTYLDQTAAAPERISAARQRNASIIASLAGAGFEKEAMAVSAAFDKKLGIVAQPEAME